MAVAATPVVSPAPVELDRRRLVVENAIGAMRIEDLAPDETTSHILSRYKSGEIALEELNRLLDEQSSAIG